MNSQSQFYNLMAVKDWYILGYVCAYKLLKFMFDMFSYLDLWEFTIYVSLKGDSLRDVRIEKNRIVYCWKLKYINVLYMAWISPTKILFNQRGEFNYYWR